MAWIANETFYATADRQRAVPEGHPQACFLIAREGCAISAADVEQYGLQAECRQIETPPDEPPARGLNPADDWVRRDRPGLVGNARWWLRNPGRK